MRRSSVSQRVWLRDSPRIAWCLWPHAADFAEFKRLPDRTPRTEGAEKVGIPLARRTPAAFAESVNRAVWLQSEFGHGRTGGPGSGWRGSVMSAATGVVPAVCRGPRCFILDHQMTNLATRLEPPRPSLDSVATARYEEQGFCALTDFATPSEVASLLGTFERLFQTQAGRSEGGYFDLMTDDVDGGERVLPNIINPNNYAPELRHMHLHARALEVAKQLLGPTATPSFQHAILKPALQGGETPWHQDEAYRSDPNFFYRQLSIWIPLQDVTVENGCMVYLPLSHRGAVLPHRSVGNDPKKEAIECVGDFDKSAGVACPLPAGGATIHAGRTLHYASSNRTDTARYAYILVYETPPEPLLQKRDFYWLREKQSAGLARKRRWRRRGGIVVEAARKMRDGMWRSPGRVVFEIRRGWHAVWLMLTERN